MIFEGVIPAVVSPFDEHGALLEDRLAEHTDWLIEAGVPGIVGTGTMGEASSLSQAERRTVIESLVGAAAGRARITAGVSAETPEKATAYARDAADAGAGGIMCLPPLGYSADLREVKAFYTAVAGATELPLMLYNNPHASGGTDLPAAVIVEIASGIDSIVAVKECSGDARRIAEILQESDGELEVLVGGDDWPLEGAAAGATGWVSGAVNVAPLESLELWEAARAGDLAHARALYARLAPLARLDMTPKLVQYFKAAMDAVGRYGGPCRPPRLPLDEADHKILDDALAALGTGALT
jgi:dihydrodipicolinate synthase/N-acetylneuraminate lyase